MTNVKDTKEEKKYKSKYKNQKPYIELGQPIKSYS